MSTACAFALVRPCRVAADAHNLMQAVAGQPVESALSVVHLKCTRMKDVRKRLNTCMYSFGHKSCPACLHSFDI